MVSVSSPNGAGGYGSNFCTARFEFETRLRHGCDNVSSCIFGDNQAIGVIPS